jgi:hypothetical protein
MLTSSDTHLLELFYELKKIWESHKKLKKWVQKAYGRNMNMRKPSFDNFCLYETDFMVKYPIPTLKAYSRRLCPELVWFKSVIFYA